MELHVLSFYFFAAKSVSSGFRKIEEHHQVEEMADQTSQVLYVLHINIGLNSHINKYTGMDSISI